MSPLTAWQNFYVIVGSSAGALTGLTFVAVTLLTQTEQHDDGRGVAAFTTPTVTNFGTVLFISAVLSAPWPALSPPAIVLGLSGLVGVLYTVIVIRRQLRLDVYTPVLEDWLYYGAFPLVAYLALLAAAILLPGSPVPALFVVGGLMLLLLFVAIHNAWDVVTYLAITLVPRSSQHEQHEQRDQNEQQE